MSVEQNIKAGRKAQDLTQEELGDLIGVTRAAIAQWEKRAPKLRDEHIIGLSTHLKMPRSAFTRFGGDTVTTTDDRHNILLLEWSDLKHVGQGGKVLKEAVKRAAYLEVSKKISNRALAFVIQDNSMEKEFYAGEEVVIDPSIAPATEKDFVLVRLKTGEHLFRRYSPRNGAYDLVPVNSDWNTVTVNSKNPAEIIGTMVEHRRRRRAP